MNIDIAQLLAKLTTFFGGKEEVKSRAIARPVRDWKIVLLCMAVGIFGSALFAGYTYYTIHSETLVSDQKASHAKINDAEIKKILDTFEARARTHQGYRQGGGSIADPSR